jgi:Potential Queuosine, Q, salvage protein family
VSDLVTRIRTACAIVAQHARYVSIDHDAIAPYAASLPLGERRPPGRDPHLTAGTREIQAAFWLTLDTINFGSGWFPTLRKRPGASGYATVAAGVRDRFTTAGPWASAQLADIGAAAVAEALGQDSDHELMPLFAAALRDLGVHVESEHAGRFAAVVDAAGSSAVALAELLGGWSSFADSSPYGDLDVPFFKRAQIAAADLHRAGVVRFADLPRLTMFADNLVPHVLRLDGILRFDPALMARIDRRELIVHDSFEEVEIRACAVHAVELLAAARPGSCAAEIDQLLWDRGGHPRYKAVPRHRSRCTAY